MFENEWFPRAYSIGITWNEFWGMNPHIIKCLEKGHENKIKEQDALMHSWWGTYGLSAVAYAVEHCLAGNKAKSKYIEKPIFSSYNYERKNVGESMEAIAVFEMKQRTKITKNQGLRESPV